MLQANCYHTSMAKTLHIRGVPDDVHATLARRAESQGTSLTAYVTEVLEEHCVLPTMDEWLEELDSLTPVGGATSGADAVRCAREEDDERLTGRR